MRKWGEKETTDPKQELDRVERKEDREMETYGESSVSGTRVGLEAETGGLSTGLFIKKSDVCASVWTRDLSTCFAL